MGVVLDLFCGPGGWATGARAAGIETVGVELDRDACLTHAAAGHRTIRADVTTFPLEHLRVDGLIASPPCPDFSLAGKQAGIDGETGRLMHEVPRWVEALRPRWVACEQVPPALEWWERFAHTLQRLGYRTWCGVLNAADYGVPQTRRRAFLLASLDRQPTPPPATHDRHPHPTLFGEPLLPWVSMASALGWGATGMPYPTIASGWHTGGPDKEKVGGSRDRERLYAEQQSGEWVVRAGSQERATVRSTDEPSPTIMFGHDSAAWTLNRRTSYEYGGGALIDPENTPAPTVTGTALSKGVWEVLDSDAEHIRLTVRDALVLQSFPPDYPVKGTKTSQFRQIGNAVPPVLAAALLTHMR